MAEILQIQLTDNAAQVLAGLQQFAPALGQAIARTLDLENEITVGQIVQTKLSQRGPTTLGVRSGRLRRSIRPSVARIAATAIESAIGSNLNYAGSHEYGVDQTVQIPAHTRRILQTSTRTDTLIGADGKSRKRRKKVTEVKGSYYVRAHGRHMFLPPRRYIAGTIEERAPQYAAALSAAVVDTWGNLQQGGAS